MEIPISGSYFRWDGFRLSFSVVFYHCFCFIYQGYNISPEITFGPCAPVNSDVLIKARRFYSTIQIVTLLNLYLTHYDS